MKTDGDRSRTTNILLTIIVVFIVGLVLKLVQHVVTALLVSLLLAYLMDTFVVFMRRLRFPLWLALSLTIVIFLGVFIGVGLLVYTNVRQFQVELPKYETKLIDMLQATQLRLQSALPKDLAFNPLSGVKNIPIASIILKTLQSVISFGLDFGIIFFFSVLILLGKHQFIRQIVKTFPRSRGSKVPSTLSHIDRNLRRYLGVKAFVSFLAGGLEMMILLLFGVKFAIIWGFMTFLINFIPSIGAIFATIVPSLFSLAQFGDPILTLWIFLAIASVHLTIGNALDPTLMGETLNLSLLVVFVSLFFWGWLWGPLGILLAVPMTATIKIILQDISSTSSFAAFLEKSHGRRSFLSRFTQRRSGGSRSHDPFAEAEGDEREKGRIVDKETSQSL